MPETPSSVFLEGNPYLLGLTMVVSLLHSLFDLLAFKNDIQFWNKNRSMEGLSAKSVVLNFVCQFIVFLYLLDNETSWMILARCQCKIHQPANKSKAITAVGTRKNESIFGELHTQLKNKNLTIHMKGNSESDLLTTVTVDEFGNAFYRGPCDLYHHLG